MGFFMIVIPAIAVLLVLGSAGIVRKRKYNKFLFYFCAFATIWQGWALVEDNWFLTFGFWGAYITTFIFAFVLFAKGYKSFIAILLCIFIFPAFLVVDENINERKFEELCETEAGLKVYEKAELPSRYFRDATDEEKKKGYSPERTISLGRSRLGMEKY